MAKTQITIPIFVPHAGCPHTCVFCNQNKISSTYEFPNEKFISDKIQNYLQSAPKTVSHIEIAFFGGSFTAIPERKQVPLLQTAASFKQSGHIHEIRLSTRPDCISDQSLSLLKKYSVDTVELGVQSFDDEVLTASNRGHSIDDVYRACDLLKKHDFKFGIQLMPGLPEDSYEKSIYSAKCAARLKPNCARIYPTIVLNGTQLAKLYNSGNYTPMEFDYAVNLSTEMKTILENAEVNVIRTGLHPLEINEKDSVIAGPYHDSFGFFVKARQKMIVLKTLLKNYNNQDNIFLVLPKTNAEEYIGPGKQNIISLKNSFDRNIYYCIDKSTVKPFLTDSKNFEQYRKYYKI